MTESALQWLAGILSERFGLRIYFQMRPDKTLLKIVACEGAISFDRSSGVFQLGCSNLAVGGWNAAEEGWFPATRGVLPTPGLVQSSQRLIERSEEGAHFNYDLPGFICWMLTRSEEIGATDLDSHRRFPASASNGFKNGYLERPIVDEWLGILGQVIEAVWPGVVLKAMRFSMLVSHDVDWPSRYGFQTLPGLARAVLADLIKNRDFQAVFRGPLVHARSKSAIHALDPLNTFDWIMSTSDRHGLKSAFYFICGRTDPRFDSDYEVEHPAIRDLMRRIHQRGHEIGLHPSYGTYQNPDLIIREAQRLREVTASEGIVQPEWGGRMHFLRWQQPTTLYGWEGAAMDYDSSLGYADRPGFRAGTCFDFPAFDIVADRALRLRIRPLIAMEVTVMRPKYMSLGDGERAFQKFKEMKDACRAVGGTFTLLWHNTQFRLLSERALYERVLQC